MLNFVTEIFSSYPWLIVLVKVLGVFAVIMPMVAYSVMAERRISALIQDRIGPNRVGIPFTRVKLLGLGQPLADGLKSFLKEDFTPAYVKRIFFWLAPAVAMIPSFVVFAVIPFGSFLGAQKMVIADLNVGILFTFGIVSLGVYGIVLAGYASNSKYPFLGGIRSSAQMISYEIAMGMAVVPVFMLAADSAWQSNLTGTWKGYLDGVGLLNLSSVIAYQSDSFFSWMIFKQPIAFCIFLVAIFAETNRLPFDMPESETELVAGYNTEYSSMRFALFFMGEYAAMIAGSALMVVLFCGGWTLPLGATLDPNGYFSTPADGIIQGVLHMVVFIMKIAVFLVLMIWIRWMLPRFRYDQLMNIGWKRFLPVSLANIILTAIVLWATA
ncbi:MAG: NADH-quinone oxidoreductase subunit H [Verrucomicrobiota bacterium]|jgi:NADH-quinone oxidoreductase subunit H|nr:NADH-quinone oxidoreductase subunit H [Verrucomicrobiota bacterium]MEE2615815.1 NADH-quinone oxidoreductase subunit H [Verrucomicrobiota bacterium]